MVSKNASFYVKTLEFWLVRAEKDSVVHLKRYISILEEYSEAGISQTAQNLCANGTYSNPSNFCLPASYT